MQLIIGNTIGLIASIIMVYAGYIKQKKKVLYTQAVQIGLAALGNLILGGITGALINILSCIRNFLCYKEKLDKKAKIILIILSIILTFSFNTLGIIGFMPLISSVTYILFMNIKDDIKFKYLNIIIMLPWLFYDTYINLYTSTCFDIMCILANIISIIQINFKNRRFK